MLPLILSDALMTLNQHAVGLVILVCLFSLVDLDIDFTSWSENAWTQFYNPLSLNFHSTIFVNLSRDIKESLKLSLKLYLSTFDSMLNRSMNWVFIILDIYIISLQHIQKKTSIFSYLI